MAEKGLTRKVCKMVSHKQKLRRILITIQNVVLSKVREVVDKTWEGYALSTFMIKKSRIRETKNLSTDADSRTDTILQRLRDLSIKKI